MWFGMRELGVLSGGDPLDRVFHRLRDLGLEVRVLGGCRGQGWRCGGTVRLAREMVGDREGRGWEKREFLSG
jgi:hypothetical protein